MKLYRKIFGIVFITSITLIVGCGRVLENAASDVNGWDISACVDGFSTCLELFTDNKDNFTDGFESALGGITRETP